MHDTIPTSSIVPMVDLKDALNVTIDMDNGKLFEKLEAARDFVEAYVGPLDDFGTADAVPYALKEALRLTAGHFYDEDAAPLPEGIFSLIGPYRRWEF